MGAFTEAVRVGAHAIETDIRLSKDGVVVLSHVGGFCFTLIRWQAAGVADDATSHLGCDAEAVFWSGGKGIRFRMELFKRPADAAGASRTHAEIT
jgi:glycerophosphoryl diester phosphodiesterase